MRNQLPTINYQLSTGCGFGVIEVILAVAIISTALFSIMSAVNASLELSRRADLSTRAGFLLGEGSEGIRMMRDTNWTNISSLSTTTTYYLIFSNNSWKATTTATSTDGTFYRTFTVGQVYRDGNDDIASSGTLDSNAKKITVNVSWKPKNATTTRSVVFYLTNFFN